MKLTKLLALIGVGAALECFNANAAIQIAYFPPVPESWNVTIEANTVIYTSPIDKKTQPTPRTTLRFNYSKATNGQDAYDLIRDYVKKNSCRQTKQLGKGFYTASCPSMSRDVVIVGEINNMYTVEIIGDYSTVAMGLINTYVTQIVTGKRTFDDREIGDRIPEKQKSEY